MWQMRDSRHYLNLASRSGSRRQIESADLILPGLQQHGDSHSQNERSHKEEKHERIAGANGRRSRQGGTTTDHPGKYHKRFRQTHSLNPFKRQNRKSQLLDMYGFINQKQARLN